MSDRGGSGLDAIARDLASGAISRRTALRRFGGVALAAVVPSALFADSAIARCPKDRRCDGTCCPNHAHCHRGKCKCNSGFTKCGKKCRNLLTDEQNCGACGHVCGTGQTCRNGHCKSTVTQTCGNNVREGTEACDGTDLGGEDCVSLGFVSGTLACNSNCTFDTSGCQAPCQSAGDCPQPAAGSCQQAVCVAGSCGFAADDTNLPDDGNQCTQNICTDGVPSNPPVTGFNACDQNGGTHCDGAGNCVPFEVTSAAAASFTTVNVNFNEAVDATSVSTNGSQFTFTGGLVASAASASGSTVTVTTSTQTAGTGYTVTVAASVLSSAGAENVSAAHSTADFVGFQCTSDTDCTGSPQGHVCLTTYGFCGCRIGFNDCPGGTTCHHFVNDNSSGFCS